MLGESSQPTPRTHLPAGTRIGKYEVIEQLAASEHASVYKCHDPVLDRLVTIKQVPSAAGAEQLERYRREARILAQLGNEEPGVTTVHELLEQDDGLCLVMEYVPGRSLESLMDENVAPAEPKAALHILWQLAGALHKAHQAGIVHRDIRPANIIVGEGLRAKITDFHMASSPAGATAALPDSARYIAPELLAGGAVDGRADMYSLGFVAYEMLLGRRRFNELFAEVIGDEIGRARRWMDWHGNELLAAPPLHSIVASVPRSLADIVARMIAKDPSQRFASMETLARTLRGTFSARRVLAAMAMGSAGPLELTGGGPIVKSRAPALARPGRGDEDIPELMAATIPAAGRPRRGRLAAVMLTFAALVAVGVALGVRSYLNASRRKQAADDAYAVAMASYGQGDYTRALREFSELHATYPRQPAAVKASVLAALARGQLAMAEDDFAAAAEQRTDAARQLNAAADDRREVTDWLPLAREHISEFDKMLRASRAFAAAAQQAEADLKAGNFDAVREAVSRTLPPLAIAPARKGQLADLTTRLRVAEFSAQFTAYLSAAKALAGDGNMTGAERELAKAGEVIASSLPEEIDPNDVERLRGELDSVRQYVADERVYQAEIANADAARRGGDKAGELAALQAAAAVRPSDDLAQQIAALSRELAVGQARQLKIADDLEQARTVLQNALAVAADPVVEAELADVKKLIRQRTLLAAGDAALRDGKLAEALAKFTEADSLGATAATTDRVSLVRHKTQLATGDEMLAAKKYVEAAAAYEKAREVRPVESAVVAERLAALVSRQEYDRLMTKAAAAQGEGNWAEALRSLMQAKAAHDSSEVNQQITQVRYRQALTLGAEAMTRGDYRAARAYFLMAKSFQDTEEVKLQLADAEKMLQAGE